MLDAFKRTYKGKDNYNIKRFILAHQILLSMEGIPAIYIQNLVGSRNDYKKVETTNAFRSINRRNWDSNELLSLLKKDSINKKVYLSILKLIKIRKSKKHFTPMLPNLHSNYTRIFLVFGDKVLIKVKVYFV